MAEQVNRRNFIKTSMAAAAGAVYASGAAAGANPQSAIRNPQSEAPGVNGMPMGWIKNLRISRLISGGNLISGWSHARDLKYMHDLMDHYNTPEKVLETLAELEENGVNTIIADPRKKPMDIFKKYWDRGGKIQWIAEGHPTPEDLKTNVKASVDWGASAVYLQGVIGDLWLKGGYVDRLGECVDYIKSLGVPGGLGAHQLDVIVNAEARGFDADFYVKTLHHSNYWSARRPDQGPDVVGNRADNFWEPTPERTIEFMQTVKKPWIAFKTLAAGAIHPTSGFKYAFARGADFICVGMFDFQVREDAIIAKKTLAELKSRERAWFA
jgi:hypothetical protein